MLRTQVPGLACLAALIGLVSGTAPCLADPPGTPGDGASAPASPDLINPDRPGIADGSNVIGAGRFQAEIGLQYEYHPIGEATTQLVFLPTLLRLGLTDNWELRIEGNDFTWSQTETGGQTSRTDGISPVSIGTKIHFIDSAGVDRPSVGAILRVFPPSGGSDFHTHRTTGDFRLTADWDFAPELSLNPNIGLARYEDASGRAVTPALFATTLNYNPSDVLNFFVDTGIQSAEAHHGRASVIVDGGTAYIVGRDVQLDASIGWGAVGRTAPRPFVAVGVSKRF